jgi:hypothetical protein
VQLPLSLLLRQTHLLAQRGTQLLRFNRLNLLARLPARGYTLLHVPFNALSRLLTHLHLLSTRAVQLQPSQICLALRLRTVLEVLRSLLLLVLPLLLDRPFSEFVSQHLESGHIGVTPLPICIFLSRLLIFGGSMN